MGATNPEVKPGGYYGPDGLREMKGNPAEAIIPAQAKDPETAKKLWEVSEKLTGVYYRF